MKKWVLAVVLLVAVVVGGALAWSRTTQQAALDHFAEAVAKGDSAAVADLVDTAAIKESLKNQLQAKMNEEMKAKGKDSDMAGPQGQMAMALVNMVVDAIVTPKGIKAMVEGGKMDSPDALFGGGASAAPAGPAKDIKWAITEKGLTSFVAVPSGKDASRASTLVFKLQGTSWKLSEIRIPKEAFDKKPEAPVAPPMLSAPEDEAPAEEPVSEPTE